MNELRELLKTAREILSLKVLPPQGDRKTWKVIEQGGKVYYSPTKPVLNENTDEETSPQQSAPKQLSEPFSRQSPDEPSQDDVNVVRDAIKDALGTIPHNVDKIIKEEIKRLAPGVGKKSLPPVEDSTVSLFTPEESGLPSVVSQPEKDEASVYKSAEKAQEEMMDILDRGNGIDKKLGATHFNVGAGDKVDLEKEGPILITAPIKGKKRATEKVESDYDGDWSRLTDMVRASIAVDDFDDVPKVIDELRKAGIKIAKKPKDRFANPTSVGYRDALLNVKYPSGHIGEIQVHLKPILKAKDTAHKDYEVVRSIEAQANKEGRETLTDEEQAEVDKASKKMKDTYDNAWRKATSKKKAASMKVSASKEYFELDGNPIVVEHNKFPVMYVKGNPKILRDFFRVHHDANPINEREFRRLLTKR